MRLTHPCGELLREQAHRPHMLRVLRRQPAAVRDGARRESDVASHTVGGDEAHVGVDDRFRQVGHREPAAEIALLRVRVAVVLVDVELHVRLSGREEDVAEDDVREHTHRRCAVAELDDVRRRRACGRCELGGEGAVVAHMRDRLLRAVGADSAHVEVIERGAARPVAGMRRRRWVDGTAHRERRVALENHVVAVVAGQCDRHAAAVLRGDDRRFAALPAVRAGPHQHADHDGGDGDDGSQHDPDDRGAPMRAQCGVPRFRGGCFRVGGGCVAARLVRFP